MGTKAIRDQVRQILIHEIAPLFHGVDLATQRANLESMGAQAELPAGVRVEASTLAGVHVERISPTASAEHEQRVILYSHGGAFSMGSCTSYRGLAARLALACDALLVLPEYRLAPEHCFPAGLDDIVAVYAALLASGIRAEQIVMAGDSAGGNLTVSAALRIAKRGLALPRALVLLSPWTDLTFSGETLKTRAAIDPWLQPSMFPPIGPFVDARFASGRG
jgi:epsilon-lactone hydrolase